ncbi:hypothetical protein AVEN_202664-1 [Araneus ventricosus]|uniref:Transposase Tc1-like domain-containing protein n=1 Tax=Araneus ventricosus TaxID=182803 RepID=A0A4Y2TRD7_ARAVE|nr:hypothetical protein AVEN_202664-1 [Araneus ventricosus]
MAITGHGLNLHPQEVRPVIGVEIARPLNHYVSTRETRILKRDRRTILPHIATDFNDGACTSVSLRTVQRTVINMASQRQRPTRVPLLPALHKALLLSWVDNTTIGLLMTGNTLPGLTSLVSNCTGRMHVHEYGDNIINP